MARPLSPDLYPDARPAGVLLAVAPALRRLKVLAYLTVGLLLVAVLGSFLPLGTWLLLCAGLAAPTLLSAMLVAGD
ncbi:MAG: hypothetical protein AB7N70_35530 [Dehalococcoidia bacterium]